MNFARIRRRLGKSRNMLPRIHRSRRLKIESLETRQLLTGDVVVSEIMYHPASDSSQEEFIELLNTGTEPVNLDGWRFTKGVDFTFPDLTLDPGQTLVVAADLASFATKYPLVTNVVGGWEGRLSNRGESIKLVDAEGTRVDRVRYADQGEWAVRTRGPMDEGHQGWVWRAEHDGGGRSLELVNPGVPNQYGQNWASSLVEGGTPGAANSVVDHDVAPLVLDVTHRPTVPHSTEPVHVTARVVDQSPVAPAATLYYRIGGQPDFLPVAMADDGHHGDQLIGDGIYGATIPAQDDGSVVEFYVQAVDSNGNQRSWPAVAEGNQAGGNALYQVLDWFDADSRWIAGDQPLTLLVMTDAERAELADIGDGPLAEAQSNAQMSGTLIHASGTGIDVRYNVGIRNRGGSSRLGPPNNYRVNVPRDRLLEGASRVNLNSRYIHAQVIGSAIYRLAGMPAAEAAPVQVRVNGTNLAEPEGPRMFGSYAQLEVIDGQFPNRHFPLDRRGNLYRSFVQGAESGDLRYEGPDPDAYRDTYTKVTNDEADDWSDLIRLTHVLNEAPDETFVDQVRQVLNLEQWLRFLALDSLLGNLETGLSMGSGDNYWLYRGTEDTRFVLIPHDLDTIMGRARLAQPDRSIFAYTATPGLRRLLTRPDIVPLYYQAYLDLIRDVFNPETLHPLLDQVLGDFVSQAEVDEMKQFVVDRIDGVLAQIPRQFQIVSSLPKVGDAYRTTLPATELVGTADAVRTQSVLVNGQPADWSALSREWSLRTEGEARTQSLVDQGSTWRYLDDGSGQPAAWRQWGFDDSPWASGPAPLGYGDGDEATRISYGPNSSDKQITSYFRREFHVGDPWQITGLTVRLLRDDGAVVYLNGEEVVRSNLPEGPLGFQTVASSWVGGGLEDQFASFSVDPRLLQQGSNLLAVELHQSSAIDFDASFDLQLEATIGSATGGVRLNPGVNRVYVQAFDGPDGTGNLLQSGYVDIWYDGSIPGRPFAARGGEGDPDPETNAAGMMGVLASPVIPGGVLEQDTVLAPVGPAYRVTGDVVVPAGVTLTVMPGTTIFFEENTGITFEGGRLVAEGEPLSPIRFTRLPGSTIAWDGLQLKDSKQDNRITHAILEYAVTEDGMIGLEDSQLLVDHVTLDHTDRFRIHSLNSSLVVRNSTFTDIFPGDQPPTTDNRSEHIWGSGIPDDGYFLIENNDFGTTKGHNDAVDFDTAQLPGPIPVIRNNTFAGGGDDALDLESDAYVEGNLLTNVRKDSFNTASGDANAISAGAGRNYTVVRNTFYNVDHAVQVKEDAFLNFVNNTVVGAGVSAIYFELVDRAPGRGAWVDSSIFYDTPVAFDSLNPTTELTVVRSVVPAEAARFGDNNVVADPRLVDPRGGDFHLRPGSSALGTGQHGRDMGAQVPGGASVSGEPASVTAATEATLTVSGPGITHYKYQLDDGPWSGEYSIDTPLRLTGLADGDHRVSVIGRNVAGQWQDEAGAFVSSIWTVDSKLSRVLISEVLATNDSAVEQGGAYPDLIELHNDGARPVDLSGKSISDRREEPEKYIFPEGTWLGPGEYLVLVADRQVDAPGRHVGFALSGDGEGLYLFDTAAHDRALLDAVEFGPQVPDLSIGRVGHEQQWSLTKPTMGRENVVQPTGDRSTLKINEWLANNEIQLMDNFLELYNPDPLPVDLEGLYLTDDPIARPDRHRILPLSFVPGGGHVTLLADGDPGAGGNHLGFRLASDQELLGLSDPDLQAIDRLIYFSQTTDVSQGRIPDGGSRFQFQRVVTPGGPNQIPTASRTELIGIDDVWAYDDRGADLGDQWRKPDCDDGSWQRGAAVLAAEDDALPSPIHTDLTLGAVTYYFRKTFTLDLDPADVSAKMTMLVDDGAVVYVNDAEVLRLGVPSGELPFNRRANRGVGNAQTEGPFAIPSDLLVQGKNAIAVEVHQISPSNNDVVFGLTLDADVASTDPKLSNAAELLDGLRVTEIMYNPRGGADFEFIEVQNVGDRVLDLTGVRFDGGIDYTFPNLTLEPGRFVVVCRDAAAFRSRYGNEVPVAGEFNGRLANEGERLVLRLPSPYEGAILRFQYDDGWYRDTDGAGNSLVIRDARSRPAGWDQASSWRDSVLSGGSPGRLVGDVNRDGQFTNTDIVGMLQAGKYLTGQSATWHEGDFNGDGVFNPKDLVLVLQATVA